MNARQEHERHLHALTHDKSKKNLKFLLAGLGVVLFVAAIGGGIVIKNSMDKTAAAQADLNALRAQMDEAEAKRQALEAQVSAAKERGDNVEALQAQLKAENDKIAALQTGAAAAPRPRPGGSGGGGGAPAAKPPGGGG